MTKRERKGAGPPLFFYFFFWTGPSALNPALLGKWQKPQRGSATDFHSLLNWQRLRQLRELCSEGKEGGGRGGGMLYTIVLPRKTPDIIVIMSCHTLFVCVFPQSQCQLAHIINMWHHRALSFSIVYGGYSSELPWAYSFCRRVAVGIHRATEYH